MSYIVYQYKAVKTRKKFVEQRKMLNKSFTFNRFPSVTRIDLCTWKAHCWYRVFTLLPSTIHFTPKSDGLIISKVIDFRVVAVRLIRKFYAIRWKFVFFIFFV